MTALDTLRALVNFIRVYKDSGDIGFAYMRAVNGEEESIMLDQFHLVVFNWMFLAQ